VLTPEKAQNIIDLLKTDALRAYDHYTEMLNHDADGNILDPESPGLARELARMNLPVNFYTQWYWKIDLHNLMHFLRLRADPHAQLEVRVYAEAILEVMKTWVPITFEAFEDYRLGAASISAKGLEVVRRLLKGEAVDQANSGMSAREWRELQQTLYPDRI
jgi:thymidylate synthase (FAD)